MTVEYQFELPPVKAPIGHPEGLAMHLGGHENETHLDDGALSYIMEKFNVKTMLDIGCGPGGMVELALDKGLDVQGVDGDDKVDRTEKASKVITIHDFATGPWIPNRKFDLGWCVEFVEHVDVEFMPNFIETFKSCKYVAMTHALPGQPGHHHVNCKPFEYWLGVMEYNGFKVLIEGTNEMRKASTMKERYIRQQGYLFENGRI